MFTVAVRRDFIAQHFLIGGDWGPENDLHSHHYVAEVQLQGEQLDMHGYLVDITDIERALEALISRYRDQTLNELPEFIGLNPSLEHLARLLGRALAGHLRAPNLTGLTVQIWEHPAAWASYSQSLNARA